MAKGIIIQPPPPDPDVIHAGGSGELVTWFLIACIVISVGLFCDSKRPMNASPEHSIGDGTEAVTVKLDAAGTWTIEQDGQVLLRSADKQEIEAALDQMEQ